MSRVDADSVQDWPDVESFAQFLAADPAFGFETLDDARASVHGVDAAAHLPATITLEQVADFLAWRRNRA